MSSLLAADSSRQYAWGQSLLELICGLVISVRRHGGGITICGTCTTRGGGQQPIKSSASNRHPRRDAIDGIGELLLESQVLPALFGELGFELHDLRSSSNGTKLERVSLAPCCK